MNQIEQIFWSYEQATIALGLPKGTLYALVHDKRIPHHRIGPRHVLFPIQEVVAWIKNNPVNDYSDIKMRGTK